MTNRICSFIKALFAHFVGYGWGVKILIVRFSDCVFEVDTL